MFRISLLKLHAINVLSVHFESLFKSEDYQEMSASPSLGRDARLFKDNAAIGYGKNISVKTNLEIIKDYSMDSLTPAVSGAGKHTLTWSMERLFTDETYLALLMASTKFDLVFAPQGSPTNSR